MVRGSSRHDTSGNPVHFRQGSYAPSWCLSPQDCKTCHDVMGRTRKVKEPVTRSASCIDRQHMNTSTLTEPPLPLHTLPPLRLHTPGRATRR